MLLSYLKYKSNGWYIICCVATWPVCRIVVVPSKTLPDDGRLLPKYVGGNTQNNGVVQISAYC
jgi:hypothetical protein